MSNHTPGPWILSPNHAFVDRVYVPEFGVELGGVVRIAHVANADGDREANAHLIAAAPELLEAGKALLGNTSGIMGLDTNEYRCVQMSLLEQLAEAIAKAEGREVTP